jgi:RNA ligase (TIGR02306 family)
VSTLHVPLTTVTEVKRHPNADKLDVAVIGGWQVVVGRDSLAEGSPVIYCPPDAMVPEPWATEWGVAPYLGKDGRVKAIKLRGEPSFGFAVPLRDSAERRTRHSKQGDNVADLFGITKYVPPPPRQSRPGGPSGDSMSEHPAFSRYTDIQNLRHFPSTFDGVPVVVTEKLHGTNSRIGVIDGQRAAGSHRVQRRHPDDRSHLYHFESQRAARAYDEWRAALPWWRRWMEPQTGTMVLPEVVNQSNPGTVTYWLPWQIRGVEVMLEALGRQYKQVILYGEIYGPSIQALGYGVEAGKVEYRAFDLMLDGKYQDYRTFAALCSTFGVPMAPLLATGELGFAELKALSEGPTTLGSGAHYREGIVVRAVTEATDPRFGRMVAKLVSDTYLTGGGEAAEDLANDAAEVVAA